MRTLFLLFVAVWFLIQPLTPIPDPHVEGCGTGVYFSRMLAGGPFSFDCEIESESGDLNKPEQLVPCAWTLARSIFRCRYGVQSLVLIPLVSFRREESWTIHNGQEVVGVMRWPDLPAIEVSRAHGDFETFRIITHECLHYLVHRCRPEDNWEAGDKWVDSESWLKSAC